MIAQIKSLIARVKRIVWIKFILDVFARYGKDNGGLLAAGLAFFLMLAFVPLLLVAIAGVGYWVMLTGSNEDALTTIKHLVTTQIVPGAAGNEVTYFIEKTNLGATLATISAKRGISALIGLLGFVWAALQIFVTGSVAMNAAWETTEKRSWIKLHLIALGLLVGTGVLILASLISTTVGSVVSKNLPGTGLLVSIGTEIGAVVVSAVMYAATYKFLPSTKVSWKAAIFGGIVAALAWEVAKKGLAVYLLRPNHTLYGKLADLFVFILWIYYSMMILLLGAETSVVYTLNREGARAASLKRAALARPADDSTIASSSPLARSKDRNRAQRLRKTGQKSGDAAPR